jgi:hypothetical protein
MNVRSVLSFVRFSRRHGQVHGLRVPNDVGRMRHVWNGRLFEHADNRARVLPEG